MVSATPAEVLRRVQAQVPFRQRQLQQLALYYNHSLPSPPILVAHGLESTQKLQSIVALLEVSALSHVVVRCKDCLSQRHFLTKLFAACVQQLKEIDNLEKYDRIDSLNSLVVNLQKLFADRDEKFVVVIDGIDQQRGATHTLLPALAKLGDMVLNLSIVLTSSSSRSPALHRSGIPFIYFPPHTRAEAITTVRERLPAMPDEMPDSFTTIPNPQLTNIYQSFVTTVYDTLTTHTSSVSTLSLQQTCEKLWPRFIWPMLSGEALTEKTMRSPSSQAKWDFARLLTRNRSLFQREGERALLPRLTPNPADVWTFEQLLDKHRGGHLAPQLGHDIAVPKQETPLLKTFSALLLVSSYLASHTPPKHDIILFSRLSSSSTNKRKYLSSALSKSRTAGVRKTPTKKKTTTTATDDLGGDETPSKKRKAATESGEGLAGERTPKSTRLLLEKTSNIPRPFTLERVIAILRTVHPDGLPRTKGAADRVYGEMAELERLRLVVRCAGGLGDGGGGRGAGGDDGILEEKWRVNVGRDFVMDVGRRWGMGLEGWEID